MTLIKQDLDAWLNQVDYSTLDSPEYVPTEFALSFMNFIKMVNGSQGESHKTPPVHLRMLDMIPNRRHDHLANLLWRGAAKTTVFMEYMTLYLSFYGTLPGLGTVDGFIYVSDSMDNGVKNARKNIEFRYNNSEFMQEWVPEAKFTDSYLEFRNKDGKLLGVKMFGAESGIRGSKLFGKRPVLAILDDLVGDNDATSPATMARIKDTVYKGVEHALDPTNRLVILNGTPFNKEDILVEAIESGGWDVNVWPVCERFPCTPEEFRGAWPDRFTYEYIKNQYNFALSTGKMAGFMQELMLRISSEEERLVQDGEIRWYPRKMLLANKHNYNFYITTDFATSARQTADYSVISVWAYTSNGDWLWVDGVCERQTMDVTVNDLFRLVQEYNPIQVGVEVSGQQGAFINWLQTEMINRNVWFNFASSQKSGVPGIRPEVDKLKRFNMVVPWFKSGKIHFPEELKASPIMGLFMGQIRLVTKNGIKGKDDCIDTISMLAYLNAWKPASGNTTTVSDDGGMWDDETHEVSSPLTSYIV